MGNEKEDFLAVFVETYGLWEPAVMRGLER